MNLRFPEIFGALLFLATLCSFALPTSASGRIANSLHFVFAPVAGPVQWAIGGHEERVVDGQSRSQPIVTDQSSEAANLREENRRLRAYVETLSGQLRTVDRREADAGIVGRDVHDVMQTVRVIGVEASGRDVLLLAGSSTAPLEVGAPVIAKGGVVGRIESVGGAKSGASVRLITDLNFKTLGRFGRFETPAGDASGAVLTTLDLEPRVIIGMGHGELRVDGLTMADVQHAGLRKGDSVLLVDGGVQTQRWPLAVHGSRLGQITVIEERRDAPGVAEVRVRPEMEWNTLREVGVVKKDEG